MSSGPQEEVDRDYYLQGVGDLQGGLWQPGGNKCKGRVVVVNVGAGREEGKAFQNKQTVNSTWKGRVSGCKPATKAEVSSIYFKALHNVYWKREFLKTSNSNDYKT